jgi:phage tail sheath gpL-like
MKDYSKLSDELLEIVQAHQLLDIIHTANNNISAAIVTTKQIEHDVTNFLDCRNTGDVMDDLEVLQSHIDFNFKAIKFARKEIKEIGYHLN